MTRQTRSYPQHLTNPSPPPKATRIQQKRLPALSKTKMRKRTQPNTTIPPHVSAIRPLHQPQPPWTLNLLNTRPPPNLLQHNQKESADLRLTKEVLETDH